MNLQESIRRILREEKEIPGYLRRRLYIADEYMDGLNADSLHDGWVMDQIDDFVRACMGAITRMIISKTSKNSDYVSEDGYMRMYDEIYGFLIKLGYQKRLFKFFYDVMMDRLAKSFEDKEDLNEEDISNKDNEEIPKYLRRRLHIADDYFDLLDTTIICDGWTSDEGSGYVSSVMTSVVDEILNEIPIANNQYIELYDKVYEDLVRIGYKDKVHDFFYDTLSDCE